jgi:chorismate synthase
MSHNSFGHLFRFTTWGESHGPALGVVVDGCPPGLPISAEVIQRDLDRRKPGQSRFTTQRREEDQVRILSGTFEDERDGGLKTTGTPISLMIENTDQRSKDYADIKDKFRPGHADFTYQQKYGIRDYKGSGRASARETAARVAAGAVARLVIPGVIRACLAGAGRPAQDRLRQFRLGSGRPEPVLLRRPDAAQQWEGYLDGIRKDGNSVGAVIEVVAEGVPPGWGAPIYGKFSADLASAMMSINAVKGVEIGAGMAAASLTGTENADEMRAGNARPEISVQQGRRHSGRHFQRRSRWWCASPSSRPPRSSPRASTMRIQTVTTVATRTPRCVTKGRH